MTRRSKLIQSVFVAACLAIIGACVYLTFGTGLWNDDVASRRRSFEPGPVPIPEPLPAPEATPPDESSGEIRPLLISGRVLGPDLAPRAGGSVRVGSETAPVGTDGTFQLGAAVRQRLLGLTYDDDGTELAFDGLLCGDEVGDGAPESTVDSLQPPLPRQPERLAWTLILPAAGAANSTQRLPLAIDGVLVEDWGHGGRIHVHGRSGLPDGAHVYVHLEFDGYRVASTFVPGRVGGGVWKTVAVAGDDQRLHAGPYWLRTTFNFRFESVEDIDTWSAEDIEWINAQGSEIAVDKEIFIGDRAEHEREDAEAREYYRPLVLRAGELRRALRSRVDDIIRLGKGWDPEILRTSRAAHAAWFEEPWIDDRGQLDLGVWREFLDQRWRPQIDEILARHRSRTDAKYREAETRLESLYESLLILSRIYSSVDLYERMGLPAHENDLYVSGSDLAEDVVTIERRVDDNIDALTRFCEASPTGSSPAPGQE